MGSPSHKSELAKIVSFRGLASQLACAECNRSTHCLHEAILLKYSNKESGLTVDDSNATGNCYGIDMPVGFTAPTPMSTNSVTRLGESQVTDPKPKADSTSCCCEDGALSKPISGCETCARVLGHGPFSLLREIDELFGSSANDAQRPISISTEPQTEVDDLEDWELLGGASLSEIAVLINDRISPRELFLRGSHTDDPWAPRPGIGAPKNQPVEGDEAWMCDEPSEYISTSLES